MSTLEEKNIHMFDESESRGYGFGINRAGTGNNLPGFYGGTNNYLKADDGFSQWYNRCGSLAPIEMQMWNVLPAS